MIRGVRAVVLGGSHARDALRRWKPLFSLLSAAILAVQTGVAIGFGVPALTVLASRHTAIEALDIFSTVVAYVGFIFVRIGVPLDLLVMALTVAIAPIAFPF